MISKLLKKNEKGFTLMEMLIVVAIIAVLIAIAIPTFNASLNKARVATDEANIRSGYASTMAEVLTENLGEDTTKTGTVKYYLQVDGSVQPEGDKNTNPYKCVGTPKGAVEIAGQTVNAWAKDNDVSYTYDYSNNKVTINVPGTVTGG